MARSILAAEDRGDEFRTTLALERSALSGVRHPPRIQTGLRPKSLSERDLLTDPRLLLSRINDKSNRGLFSVALDLRALLRSLWPTLSARLQEDLDLSYQLREIQATGDLVSAQIAQRESLHERYRHHTALVLTATAVPDAGAKAQALEELDDLATPSMSWLHNAERWSTGLTKMGSMLHRVLVVLSMDALTVSPVERRRACDERLHRLLSTPATPRLVVDVFVVRRNLSAPLDSRAFNNSLNRRGSETAGNGLNPKTAESVF